MYPEARELYQRGFPAQSITEHILDTYLTFSFYDPSAKDEGAYGITRREARDGEKGPWWDIQVQLAPQ